MEKPDRVQTSPLSPGLPRRLAGIALDILLPPQCLGCGAIVATSGSLCGACWEGVTFLAPPHCAACGLPFEFALDEGALCGACIRRRPGYDRARAAMAYDGASRGMILAFKYGDRTDAASALAGWLARAGAELVSDADLIVPVPLHWTRLFTRRFNQAALLGRELGRRTGVGVEPDALVRHRRTPSQGRLGPAARRRNLRGAFAVRDRARSRIEGRRVLLVDDVLTTGATAESCGRTLLRAGAGAVDVLTLARVVRPAF